MKNTRLVHRGTVVALVGVALMACGDLFEDSASSSSSFAQLDSSESTSEGQVADSPAAEIFGTESGNPTSVDPQVGTESGNPIGPPPARVQHENLEPEPSPEVMMATPEPPVALEPEPEPDAMADVMLPVEPEPSPEADTADDAAPPLVTAGDVDVAGSPGVAPTNSAVDSSTDSETGDGEQASGGGGFTGSGGGTSAAIDSSLCSLTSCSALAAEAVLFLATEREPALAPGAPQCRADGSCECLAAGDGGVGWALEGDGLEGGSCHLADRFGVCLYAESDFAGCEMAVEDACSEPCANAHAAAQTAAVPVSAEVSAARCLSDVCVFVLALDGGNCALGGDGVVLQRIDCAAPEADLTTD